MTGSKIHHLQCFAKKNKWAHMQEISEPEYKNLTSLEELEKNERPATGHKRQRREHF